LLNNVNYGRNNKNPKLKINQDNTINISIVEEKLYSKEDMLNFAKKYFDFKYDMLENISSVLHDITEEIWIKENL